jgi:hypothetical protein
MSTPASTRPDGNPADVIVSAFAALRARYAEAPAVVERMLAGDVEAILLGRSWVAEVESIDTRLDGVFDDTLKMYDICGVRLVADALSIVDGEADPRDFATDLPLTPEIVARWALVAIRREITMNRRVILKFVEAVSGGRLSQDEADEWAGQLVAENDRLTAELADLEETL